ncbi:hypothetical protein SAMN04487895_101660 [Paenibacillus sophorae]|uniref:Uncharacterized protein n=1 Tax=Paenibacillus sophorae TaxID=1333845 RepID=A0A1H8GVH8_9BACL|nr:hypothetical protein [Paenibacillus sophorae]QWU14357.1 hypothetical protein KP014_20845 [Paenibacillus sophorae]SEN48013.1 hypothetical protein SAMN04487895_101660 [Paenibacillus sophorae]
MKNNSNGFTFVVVNNTTKEFNVHSNVFDDTALTNAVAEAQERGLDVRCFTDNGTTQHVIEQYRVYGYIYTMKNLI